MQKTTPSRPDRGRPREPTLPASASQIIRDDIDSALENNDQDVRVLAGASRGFERGERALYNDISRNYALKVRAAAFMVRRAFELHLINRDKYLELKALIALFKGRVDDEKPTNRGVRLYGGFYLGAALDHDVVEAIKNSPLRRMRPEICRAVTEAVQLVLSAARARASRVGVPQAFAEYQRRHAPRIMRSARKYHAGAQLAAFAKARRRLGKKAPATLVSGEIDFSYSLFDED
jgi:hypothetical protein